MGKIREIRSDVPVIVASGSCIQQLERHFVNLNVNDFIQKPCQSATLREKRYKVLVTRDPKHSRLG